jgi:hypothetical protein
VDLDLAQRAGGLLVYRNARAFPRAGVLDGETALEAARRDDPLALSSLQVAADPLARAGTANFQGPVDGPGPSLVQVATAYDPRWQVVTEPPARLTPFPSFGWAVGFEVPQGTRGLEVSHGGGTERALELAALGVLWAAALWVLRRRRPSRPEPPVRVSRAERDGETDRVPTAPAPAVPGSRSRRGYPP